MGVYFRGIQVLMAQHLLHGLLTSTPFCSIRVAAVWRSLWEEYWVLSRPASSRCRFTSAWTMERLMRRFCWGKEQGVPRPAGDGSPHRQILLQSRLTRLIEVDDADLLPFPARGGPLECHCGSGRSARDPQTAVEKNSVKKTAVILLPIRAVYAV